MTYQETMAYLYAQLPFFQKQGEKAYRPKLTNIILLCDYLGNPQNNFKSIHVAGTNGKGSSSHFLASIFQEANFKTGLYTSPHLKDFSERFKVNGQDIENEYIVDFVEKHKCKIEEIKPSFFEVSVALAFQYFSDHKVDIAIIEVGLGGLFDSTNIILPEICLITNIGLDHTNILGNTIEEIAFQKAGIIKKETPCVISEYNLKTKPIFQQKADESNAEIIFAQDIISIESITEKFDSLKINIKIENETLSLDSGLYGTYQQNNIRGVVCIINRLINKGWNIKIDHILNGVKKVIVNTGLKGRWQILGNNPLMICDTGHNLHALKITLKKIIEYPYENLRLILGFVNDKDIAPVFKILPKNAIYYLCGFDSFRSASLEMLSDLAIKHDLNFSYENDVNMAIDKALNESGEKDLIFIGGSTYLVAEINNL